ncbi:MAG TPA: hypothetical protein VFD76_11360 [Gemmatimonadales bacterium]|nr:hypothetical protein [Gemmatimonadales bacterium]
MLRSVTTPARDLLTRRGTTILVYAVPTVAIAATDNPAVGDTIRTVVWTVGFAVMGIACTFNAVRCRRVHCYFTGPFYLLLAAASLLHGLRVVSLGQRGWQWLAVVAVVGTVVFLTLPERIWGRYATRAGREGGASR